MNLIDSIRIKIVSWINKPYESRYKPACVCPIDTSNNDGTDISTKPACQCKDTCPIYASKLQKTR